jgi:hypothetical protein
VLVGAVGAVGGLAWTATDVGLMCDAPVPQELGSRALIGELELHHGVVLARLLLRGTDFGNDL